MPHTLEHVEAVLKGGADVLKMRCNIMRKGPLQAGIVNGPFQERKGFLKQVIDMAGDIPVGLVPGLDDAYITEAERFEMEEMGFDYFNSHFRFAPSFMFESKVLTSVVAMTPGDYDTVLVNGVNASPKVDVVEANFVAREDMGTKFVYEDVLRYTAITKMLHQPIIATGQRIMQPKDVRHLYEAGCKAFMVGNIAFIGGGQDSVPTPETCLRVTAAFREEIEKL